MKKLFVISALFLVLVGCYSHNQPFSLQDYFEGEYSCYSNSASPNCMDLGFCFMSSQPVSNPVGESMSIDNLEPVAALKQLNATIVKTEALNNGAVVIYAFTNKINRNVEVDGKKVNLQIVSYLDHCVVGWPLILGSF